MSEENKTSASVLIRVGGHQVDASVFEYPFDRAFRNAWALKDDNPAKGIIVVDMERAREIWRDNLRRARNKPLLDLDAKFMKALETGADTKEIVAQKQVLRDCPKDPRIDQAKTPEDLKKVIPAGLTLEDILK